MLTSPTSFLVSCTSSRCNAATCWLDRPLPSVSFTTGTLRTQHPHVGISWQCTQTCRILQETRLS